MYTDFCAGSGVSKLAPGQPEPLGRWEAEELKLLSITSPDFFSKLHSQPGSAPLQPHPLCLSWFLPLPWPLLTKKTINRSTLGPNSLISFPLSGLMPSSPTFSPPFLHLSLLLMQNPSLALNAETELSTRI